MRKFMAVAAMAAFTMAGPTAQAQSFLSELEGPGLSTCLTSIFDNLRQQGRTQWRQKLDTCNAFIATSAGTLTGDEYFSVMTDRTKLDYLNRDYGQMAADVATAKTLVTVEGDPAETAIRTTTVAALEIFLTHLDDKSEAVLKRAHALSDASPDLIFPHRLYMNLAFSAGAYDDAMEALRRQMRLQPNLAGFIDMARMLSLEKQHTAALQALVSSLDTARQSDDVAPTLLMYAQVEAAAGDYERAGQALALLQADKPEGERHQVQAQLFSDLPSLARKSFNLRLNYQFNKQVKIETAINLMERGDNAGAVAALGDTSLFCRDLRCMRLQAVVAEAHGDTREADRLRLQVSRSVSTLTRTMTSDWETDFLLSLPSQPLERFTRGKSYTPPEIATFEDEPGLFRITWSDETAVGETRARLALIAAAKAAMKERNYPAFVVGTVKLGYSYTTRGKEPKEFKARSCSIMVMPVGGGTYDSLGSVPWRQIAAN